MGGWLENANMLIKKKNIPNGPAKGQVRKSENSQRLQHGVGLNLIYHSR